MHGSLIVTSAVTNRSLPHIPSTQRLAAEACAGTNSASTATVPRALSAGHVCAGRNYRWMPSIATDRKGNIGVGYSYGGAAIHVGQRFAARLASDPRGTMTLQESVLAEGQASQTTTLRWETTPPSTSTRATTAPSGTSAITSRPAKNATQRASAPFACPAAPPDTRCSGSSENLAS